MSMTLKDITLVRHALFGRKFDDWPTEEEARRYAEMYLRYLQAKNNFPGLNHNGHEPKTEMNPIIAWEIRDQIERDFHRSL